MSRCLDPQILPFILLAAYDVTVLTVLICDSAFQRCLGSIIFQPLEMMVEELLAHTTPQDAALFQRMPIVESGVNSRPKYLVKQIVRIFKRVRVHAVWEGETVYNDVHLGSVEIVFNQLGDAARYAAVAAGYSG